MTENKAAPEGQSSGPLIGHLTQARVESFAATVGASWKPGQNLPATILTIFREGEFILLKRLGIELHHVLHLSQDYRLDADLPLDQEIRYETRVASWQEKSAAGRGRRVFLNLETDFLTADSKSLARAVTALLFRPPAAEGAQP